MPTFPVTPRAALLEWCQVHDPIFFERYDEIGIAKDQAEIFRVAVQAAGAALLAQEQARQAALAATLETERAFATLSACAGGAVKSIRAFAGTSPDEMKVYAIAQVPSPANPSPVPPPVMPSGLSARLDAASGSITLRWKATNPTNARGTTYIIRRRLAGESMFSFIGVSGKKTFVDDTLRLGEKVREGIHAPAGGIHAPAGGIASPAVQYTVQGQRADLSGPVSPILTVNFGKMFDGRSHGVAAHGSMQAAKSVAASGRGHAVAMPTVCAMG